MLFLLFLCLLASCDQKTPAPKPLSKAQGEYIYRLHDEYLFSAAPPQKMPLPIYPWEEGKTGNLPKITKEYFRCKGSSLNPPHPYTTKKGEVLKAIDCNGTARHGLPMRQEKEFIYPIFLELLNHLQAKTGKRVVITSGHRCAEHNLYVNPDDPYSKHQIGAEVSFYLQGLEDRPDQVVKLIQSFYTENPKYKDLKDYITFKRFEKPTDTYTQPWYNKEIYIKLYSKKEGRNFDNRHPYPYLSLQVRHDRDLNERVIYDWRIANQCYQRR